MKERYFLPIISKNERCENLFFCEKRIRFYIRIKTLYNIHGEMEEL